VTLGDIARILTDKGQVDEALELHRERLAVYEQLGDTRSRAVTLGDIARILRSKGQVDEALELQEERLQVNRGLEDLDGVASTLYDMALLFLDEKMEPQKAYESLSQSYEILLEIGRLEGIAMVGVYFGQLHYAHNPQQGMEILNRSIEGFKRLGMVDWVQHVQNLIDELKKS
jgi:tetratricopeptide (TPR) repeat protein